VSEESKRDNFRVLENIIFLKKSRIFSPISTSDLRAIAEIADETEFAAGEVVVRENEIGDSLFVIKKGIVRVTKKSTGTNELELARLSVGECFGDMAIFDAELRSATVSVQEPCSLLRIGSEPMLEVLSSYPTIAVELIRVFVRRLRNANETIQQLSVTRH
jgi:CRP-like cAMP-binding protein